jgi:predicted acyl esterase
VHRKGLIGPWAHAYPHFARPGPQIGFLQEMLRWWDYWLKGIDTGVMDEPMLRAWMTESVEPAPYHEVLPGRWIAEKAWPRAGLAAYRLFLTEAGLRGDGTLRTPRPLCSPQTVGKHAGEWCPFGRSPDQAGDQREDDARSLVFESLPLEAPIEILGAALVTLDLVSDAPIANLAVRLCDVHPSGAVLRVSYGVLNLTHRDGHEKPAPLVVGRRYKIRVQLNDAGAVFPVGHKVRLALSTAYWPMIWPSPVKATLTIFGGTLDLPVRAPGASDALPLLPDPQTALPEPSRVLRPGVVCMDRIGLELAAESKSTFHVEEDDPLSAVAELSRTETISRDTWRVGIETVMRLSCTKEAFRLQATLRAHEGANEVCYREWDCSIPRDFV